MELGLELELESEYSRPFGAFGVRTLCLHHSTSVSVSASASASASHIRLLPKQWASTCFTCDALCAPVTHRPTFCAYAPMQMSLFDVHTLHTNFQCVFLSHLHCCSLSPLYSYFHWCVGVFVSLLSFVCSIFFFCIFILLVLFVSSCKYFWVKINFLFPTTKMWLKKIHTNKMRWIEWKEKRWPETKRNINCEAMKNEHP